MFQEYEPSAKKLSKALGFKGNGMHWKKADNESVLEVRLAVFNETLEQAFEPTPQSYKLASGF